MFCVLCFMLSFVFVLTHGSQNQMISVTLIPTSEQSGYNCTSGYQLAGILQVVTVRRCRIDKETEEKKRKSHLGASKYALKVASSTVYITLSKGRRYVSSTVLV